MIDIWLIFNLLLPFIEVLVHTYMDTLRSTCCEEERCERSRKTRSSWLNCALRDDEAVYWVSIGHYEAVGVGN